MLKINGKKDYNKLNKTYREASLGKNNKKLKQYISIQNSFSTEITYNINIQINYYKKPIDIFLLKC